MTYEERLKRYFAQESVKGDLSAQQWEDVFAHVKSHEQRRGVWRLVTFFIPRRPLFATAVTLVILVVAGGTSLWVTAPWEGPSDEWSAVPVLERPGPPGRPGPSGVRGVQGPPSMPAPRILEDDWKVDKSLITPGEPIMISLTLKNVWDKTIEIRELPVTTPLTNVDRAGDEPVLLEWEGGRGVPHYMEPGDELTLVANMPSSVSAGLQPGRHHLRFDLRFAKEPGNPDRGETGIGFGGGRFVVVPPEGALDKTVIVGEAQEANGTRITLERIRFSPEESTIEVLAPLLPNESTDAQSLPVPVPTATAIPAQGTPTPTAIPLPAGFNVDVSDLTARYRIDGGPWHQLKGHGYRVTQEGIHHKWTLGPVSANTKTLVLAIAPDARPVSKWLWEWSVALQKE